MNRWLFGAGILNFIVALMHVIMGYNDPLTLLNETTLNSVQIATLLAVWYMASLVMFLTSFVLLTIGFKPYRQCTNIWALSIGVLYLLFAFIFVVVNVLYQFHALPQWILLLGVSLLSFYGLKSNK